MTHTQKRQNRGIVAGCGFLALLWAMSGAMCVPLPTAPSPEKTFPTSLHATRNGKQTFYEAADGFATLTGIPYDDLVCKKCHAATLSNGDPVDAATYAPSCADCHVDPDNPTANVADETCLGCHGRQDAEKKLFTDVHRDAGMGCADCHSAREMHGDGTEYASLLSDGALDTDCENCHVAGGSAPVPGPNTFHSLHQDKLHCSACHVKSVSTCYSCHFESEVAETGKRFFNQTPRFGFKMLMNYKGKVYPAAFQSLVNDGKSFVAIAPFYAHSITKDGITCGDCHRQGGSGNANVEEYKNTGKIVVTSWNAAATGADRLVGPTGVIPITQDWKTALEFAHVDYTGNATDPIDKDANLPLWDFLKNTTDGSHIVFGSPLTQAQMDALTNN